MQNISKKVRNLTESAIMEQTRNPIQTQGRKNENAPNNKALFRSALNNQSEGVSRNGGTPSLCWQTPETAKKSDGESR